MNDPRNAQGQMPTGMASPSAVEQGLAQGTRLPPSTPSQGSCRQQSTPGSQQDGRVPNVAQAPGLGIQQGPCNFNVECCQGFGFSGPQGPQGVSVGNVANASLQGMYGSQFGNVPFGCQRMGCAPSVPVGNDQRRNSFTEVNSQRHLFGNDNVNIGVSPVQDVMRLASGMNSSQVLALAQFFQEQVRSRSAVLPEVFGQMSSVRGEPFLPDMLATGLPLPSGAFQEGSAGAQGSGEVGRSQLDVFSKTEKWIGSPPQPLFDKWVNRESEVLGWAQYVADLSAWASQASLEFGNEIQQSSKWGAPIKWNSMTMSMRSRSMRLLAILRSTFMNHPRSATLIGAFMEGVNLVSMTSEGGDGQQSNGYELLRQLTQEFSLRSRSEALMFRTALASRSFHLSPSETSPTTVVGDTVRKIELEAARYQRLLNTLPSSVDTIGLQVTESDLLMVLVRSLPEQVRGFVLHHASGETYQAFRSAACRYEQQQRLFSDVGLNPRGKQVAQVETCGETEWFNIGDAEESLEQSVVNSVGSGSRCDKCSSKKHATHECTVDLTKTKCFRCGSYGHVSLKCPKGSKAKGKGKGDGLYEPTGKGKSSETKVAKGDQWDKGKKGLKGKEKGSKSSKGFGKKGKLNELEVEAADMWWYQDDSWWSDVNSGWATEPWTTETVWFDQSWTDGPGYESNDVANQETSLGSLILAPLLNEGNLCDKFCETSFCLESECIDGFPSFHSVDGLRTDCGLVGNFERQVDSSCLCSPCPTRVQIFQTHVSTFLNEPEHTCSMEFEWQHVSPLLVPLLSELCVEDTSWWLLDSGASATVMSQSTKHALQLGLLTQMDDSQYRAANGSPVVMSGVTEISVWVLLSSDGSKNNWKKARLRSLVGNIRHNILSTSILCQSGWEFTQTGSSFSVRHVETGCEALETAYFAGCPWVRLRPDSQSFSSPSFPSPSLVVSQCDESCASPSLNPLSKAAQSELENHRLQGHTPHHPGCIECARGRGVFKHKRRTDQGLQCEVQADFCFVTSTGEVLRDDQGLNNVKLLVLIEMVSGAVGYVVVGKNLKHAQKSITDWLDMFGLSSSFTSVVLHTDSEKAVSDLVVNASSRFSFFVRKAPPQQHRSIGGAERAVRRLKEGLTILRADMNHAGIDVVFDQKSLQEVVTYLALSHDHFGKCPESDFSPFEAICGRRLSKPPSAMYGSLVLAELPDSVRVQSPNETRSIEAAFMHTGMDHGCVVQGFVRIEDELVLYRFVARNVRPVLPIQWKVELCPGLLSAEGRQSSEGGELVGAPVDGPAALPESEAVGQDSVPLFDDDSFVRQGIETRSNPHVARKRSSLVAQDESSKKVVRFAEGSSPAPVGGTGSEVSGSSSSGAGATRSFGPTRHCPACESGMEAPGIRHNAECRRRRAAFDSKHLTPGELQSREEEYQQRFKRPAEVAVDDLEREIQKSKDELEKETLNGIILNLSCFDSGVQLEDVEQACGMLTSETLVSETVSSIRFDPGQHHEKKKVPLGNGVVYVWAPDVVIDDATLESLDPKQGFLGMIDEVNNLNTCKVGVLLREDDVNAIRKLHKHARVIASRWVCAKKPSKVRSRIVAKDLSKRGGSTQSARSLGFSSPTPSSEALYLVLSLSATRDWRLVALDISHAFMHSPLPSSQVVVLRLPLSVSHLDGSVAYLQLARSLNGLRDASLHWLNLLAETVKEQGLWNDDLEPCLYQGSVFGVDGSFLGLAMLLAYVDDILVSCSSEEAEASIIEAISRVVPTKVTGRVGISHQKGGKVTFIGREIFRNAGESALFVLVNPSYLNSTFQEYGIDKGTSAVPDVSSFLEKQDQLSVKPLSPESYERFRRALGRLIWLGQTRSDLKLWLSLVGTQQATPTHSTEMALKSILRFMFWDRFTLLRMPSLEYDPVLFESETSPNSSLTFLHTFSDASHAPYKFNKRKGISGGIIMIEGSLIRAQAKQQQATALSSCESELYAIQYMAQESVSLAQVVHRVLFGLGEALEREPVSILLESDSASAIQLVKGIDVPRRSRRVEIRLHWLRSKIEENLIKIKHKRGTENPADLFTKCLGTRLFEQHRKTLGFVGMESPVSDLMLVAQSMQVFRGSAVMVSTTSEKTPENLAPASGCMMFLEVCCVSMSNLRKACERSEVPYVGVVLSMEKESVFRKVRILVCEHLAKGFHVHVHVNTLCKPESLLKRFQNSREICDGGFIVWQQIMEKARDYLSLGSSKSFDLPFCREIGIGESTVLKTLEQTSAIFQVHVKLCCCGYFGTDNLPVGKTLWFASDAQMFCELLGQRFRTCRCEKHANFSKEDCPSTMLYSPKLAQSVLKAAQACVKWVRSETKAVCERKKIW